MPGAFTPTCSKEHLPGFIDKANAIKAKGVDTIACMAVNDMFVMDAWGNSAGAGDKVLMLADGNGTYAAALGLELDASGFGLGTRGQRFALVVEDATITQIHVEAPMEVQSQFSREHPGEFVAGQETGWGQRIRTSTGGVRVRCPTIRRAPNTSALIVL